MMKTVLSSAIAILVPILLAWLGLSRALGAHPFWEVQTIAIGAPIGVLLILGAQMAGIGQKWLIIAAVILLIAAISVATYGKMGFVAAYGDDRFAGQLWYFGWIAVGAFSTATLFALAPRK